MQDEEWGPFEPFERECQAYGRIYYRDRKKPIAVPCRGFITIPATKERYFWDNYGISDWGRDSKEYDLPESKRLPFCALVKDFVDLDAEPPLSEKLVKSMLAELKSLRSLDVYNCDVKWSNYKGGHLVDFSSALTRSHYLLTTRSPFEIRARKAQDLCDFDEMVQKLGIKTNVKASPDLELIRTRLRPNRRRQLG
jgi:hypothetical protein